MNDMKFSLLLKARLTKHLTIINEKYEASIEDGEKGDQYYKGCRDAYENVIWLLDLYQNDNNPKD